MTIFLSVLFAAQAFALTAYAQNQTCPEGQHLEGDTCVPDAEPDPLPDLVAGAINVDTQDLAEGDEVMLKATIRNDGTADGAFDVDFLIDGAVYDTLTGNSLAPGGSLELSRNWITTGGDHTYKFFVDPDNVVDEESEDNNWLEMSIHVSGSTEPASEWITDSYCDGNTWVEKWTNDAGETWTENIPDAPQCTDGGDYKHGWPTEVWCEGDLQYEAWEYEDGTTETKEVGPCQPDEYGCFPPSWWDHYQARCVDEAEWELQDAFWQCTENAHRSTAAGQKEKDIAAREQREDRWRLEEQAFAYERSGEWEKAEPIWEEIDRLNWLEMKQMHDYDRSIQDANDACIDKYAAEARANGWDAIAEEFERHRFQAMAAQPMPGPGPMECGAPPEMMDDHYPPEGDHARPTGTHDGPAQPAPATQDGYGVDQYGGAGGGGPGPMPHGGPPCGDAMPMGGDFGLPEEAQADIRAIMEECHARMWEIEVLMFEAETWDEAKGHRDGRMDVERECQQKMEEVFRQYNQFDDQMDRHFGGFSMTETSAGIEVMGRNLIFTGDPERSLIKNFNCQGNPVLSKVAPYFIIEDVQPVGPAELAFSDIMGRHGDMQGPPSEADLADFARSAFMVVHDNPHCNIQIDPGKAGSADEPEVKVEFSSIYTCEALEAKIVCTDADGGEVLVKVHGAMPVRVNDYTFIVKERVDIMLAGGVEGFDGFEEFLDDEDFGGSAAVKRDAEGKLLSQEVALGDLQMSVGETDDGEGIKLSLASASHVGKYVVLYLDVFDDCKASLRGWDTTDGSRDPLTLRKANNLVDALDVKSGTDEVTWWLGEDENGCVLLLSNPHFSEKEFVLHQAEGGDEAGGLQINIPGFEVVFLSLGLLGAVAAVRSRRRG